MTEKPQRTRAVTVNLSTEKALALIELLAEKKEPMRLLDIAKELQINASTALRFLTALQNCGYICQNKDTMKYSMTFKICRIANCVKTGTSIVEIAHPYLRQLSKVFGESTCLAIEQDMSVIYIDAVEGPDQMLRTMQRIGNTAPMHCTGMGKLLLLNYSENQIDRLIEEKGLLSYTKNTIMNKKALMAELDTIKKNGFAYDNEECEIGARCIAYPIRDYTGKVIAGLSVTGPTSRLTFDNIDHNREQLKKVTEEISQRMGYVNS